MKKLLLSIMAFSMVLLTGCSKQEPEDLLDKIQEEGKMVVAMEGTWAPWTYHDEKDNLVGFDVEVSKAIGEKLGVDVEFVEGEWDGLFGGLDSKRYDIIVNGVEYSDERAEKYDFTEPYAYIKTVLVVSKDNNDIKSFEDLKGKKTANSVSSTYETLAQSYGATNEPVDSIDQTMKLVIDGRVDATLNANVSYADYIAKKPDAPLKVVAETSEASHVVIPVRKGEENKKFKEAVDKAIKELKEDGTLSKISIKYFGMDITE